jgi:hypothetical protein
MLDPEEAGRILQHHFDTVTPEEFVARVKRISPDFAREMWGDRSVEEICARSTRPARRTDRLWSTVRRSVLRLFS